MVTKRLSVQLSADLTAPSADHRLLTAFHFGPRSASLRREPVVNPGLTVLSRAECYECWWYIGDVNHRTVGDIRIAECDDYACVVLQREDVPPDRFGQYTQAAYRDLLGAVRTTGHRHLVRFWNYFSQINECDGDAEKYRQFSIGRAEAFDELGVFDASVPAGTAVGCAADGGLSIIALVSKHAFSPAENPRQLSAYHYPKQYGPRSPKFSRGGSVTNGDHHLFLISGTAAVVGHETVHPYEARLQTAETVQNLQQLSGAMSGVRPGAPAFALDGSCLLRVYLRNPDDLDPVATLLCNELGAGRDNIVFLQGDICRRELMVEIDGVNVIAGSVAGSATASPSPS